MFSEAVAVIGGVRESARLLLTQQTMTSFDVGATKRCHIDVGTTSIRRRVHLGLAWIQSEKSKTARLYKQQKS